MKNKLKRILAILLVAVSTILLIACGNNNSSSPSTTTTGSPSTNNGNTSTTQVDKFEQFEKALSDKGISFEIVDKAASLVGAKEGYGYVFDDETSVEIYLFDKNSDAYKAAVKSNKITVEGFGFTMDVVFNGDICIYYSEDFANKAAIQAIFAAIK